MRLLHTKTLNLHEFMENEIPPYAILSHTWGIGEVSFQDMKSRSQDPSVEKKLGYQKIARSCKIASGDGFSYAWVDTCCIDKTSSSELSEAINSMYAWYEKAEVCYAYIADYKNSASYRSHGVPEPSFADSRWFTRGWTLQELIAPSTVIFFDQDWNEMGTRSSLRDQLSAITGIHVNALLGRGLQLYSVAQKMSWASNRQTTRLEDIAYCLMGIFGVHMPMLYGEGKRAFARLQEAIMTRSSDHTLFAWENVTPGQIGTGLLAESPADFRDSSSTIRASMGGSTRRPFAMTNEGIHLELPMMAPGPNITVKCEQLAILDCRYSTKYTNLIALCLVALPGRKNTFYVNAKQRLVQVKLEEKKAHELQELYIMPISSYNVSIPSHVDYSHILVNQVGLKTIKLYDVQPPMEKDSPTISFPKSADRRAFGALRFSDEDWNACVIILLKGRGDHGVDVAIGEASQTTKNLEETLNDLEKDNDPVTAPRGALDIAPDRLYWQHPSGKWWVSVGLKRKIVDGRKVVEMTIEEVKGWGWIDSQKS